MFRHLTPSQCSRIAAAADRAAHAAQMAAAASSRAEVVLRAAAIADRWARGIVAGDGRAAAAQAKAGIQHWNALHPDRPIRITTAQAYRRARALRADQRGNEK